MARLALAAEVAPDGKAGEDVYGVIREAIEKTGRIALARVVISQRGRTVALRPLEGRPGRAYLE